jgi:hypothetical protein
MAFRRAVLSPGDRIRVGRTSLADFVVASDEQLLEVHWELSWDGTTCEAWNLGGAGRLLVGGERKEHAGVRSGAWIRAGRTDFSVFFEDMVEVSPVGPGDGSGMGGAAQRAFDVLREVAGRGRLFAVLDAASSERVVPLLQRAADEHDSLYQGLLADSAEDVAPYLVRFEKESRLLRRLVLEGWGQSWGSYLESAAKLEELRGHFRRLLMVTRERDGEPMYFRFYDPRVLRAFLPCARVRQVEQVFGPVERFFTEVEGAAGVQVFRRGAPGTYPSEPAIS